MAHVRNGLALLGFVFLAAVAAAQIGIGDKREDVLQSLGKPQSVARRGDHEIFTYPKGGRIEFVAGQVVDVKGPLPSPIAPMPTPAGADAATPATAAQAPAPPTSSSPPTATAPANAAGTASAPQPANAEANPASAANDLARHVEKMDTAWGESPARDEPDSPFTSLPAFFTGLLLRFGFTIIALKLAFKYWEMDAFWKGILLIAGIDLALHAILELLGPISGGLTTMSAVENGVPGLVLIYTINRFCFNKRIQNAVATAAAVKVVVTLLYLFGGVALLHLAYG